MREIVSTVTSKGQLTVPIEVRKHLGLDAGTKIAFVIDDEGNVSLRPPKYPTIASLAGAAGTLPTPMTWEEVRQIAIDDYVTEKYGDLL